MYFSNSDVGDDEDTTEAMETDPVPEEPVPDLTTEPQPGTSTSEAADAQLSYKIEQLQAQLANMTTELDNIKADNKTLQQNLQMERFGLQRFGSSDSDIKFFTGFPNYNVLMSFIRYIRSSALTMQSCYYVPSETLTCAGRPRSMLVEDELFMFLCRIRLGLMEQDLGIRFNCSQQTVSRKLITWANFLYFVLGSWPFWLDKSTVMQRLPPTFKESYPQTRVIIDCTEIRVQSPSSLVLNSQTYSSYKGTNTFKCLIGIAPHGAVTFVSLLFTGCMSDVEITKLSGILDLLEAEDSVMADKGFTLAKVLAEKEVTLNIPPFLGASGQFPAAQVLETQSIAKVRIHVERAIERIKRNHIFSSPLPWSLAGTANQLWTVACLLTNVQGPLINIWLWINPSLTN